MNRMLEFADVSRSSPLAEGTEKETPDVPSVVPSDVHSAAPARAPSTPSSFRTRFFSPNLNQLTRSLSLSPLASRNSRAGLRSRTSPHKQGVLQKMSNPSSPPTPDTVRKRRGFRPLSIVTSALFPFDFDPVQTMENAMTQTGQALVPTAPKTRQDHSAELCLPQASSTTESTPQFSEPQAFSNKCQSSDQSVPQASPSATSDKDSDSESTPSPSKAASVKTTVARSDAGEDVLSVTSTIAVKRTRSVEAEPEKISIAEYLRRKEVAAAGSSEEETTTESNTKDVQITDEYPQFYNLPPPDPNQHPAFRLDPFNCTDDARPLMTNWTKYQIKQWTADKYLRDRGMLPEQNETKSPLKKIIAFDKKSPEKEETSIFEALAEGSPAPPSAKRKTPQTPRRDTLSSTAPSDLRIATSTGTPVSDEFDKKSGGIRSLSNLFKSRSSTDTSKPSNASTVTISSPVDPPVIHPTATPELRRYDLVC